MVSIIEFSVTSATTVRLLGLRGGFAQRDNGLFGSASIRVTAAGAVARQLGREKNS